MKTVGLYFLRLLKIWITWLFIILDAVGIVIFCVLYFVPNYALPQWTFWFFLIITIFGFIGANIKLFADQQSEINVHLEKISEFEDSEANIFLEVIQQEFNHSRSSERPPFPFDEKLDYEGFTKSGIPGWVSLWARVQIRNTGWEQGELGWELDRTQTTLPTLFEIDDKETGCFGYIGKLTPRTRREMDFKYFLKIAEKNKSPEIFAEQLGLLGQYQIVIRFWTERITGTSETKHLYISGDFLSFRQQIIEYWEGRSEFSELIKIVNKVKTAQPR